MRNSVYTQLINKLPSSACYQKLNESTEDLMKRLKIDEKWQNNVFSNFEYIMIVNLLAGRSLQDITQYPVYPWVLNYYDSSSFDLQ